MKRLRSDDQVTKSVTATPKAAATSQFPPIQRVGGKLRAPDYTKPKYKTKSNSTLRRTGRNW